jgi:hypothetical protein
MPNPSPQRNDEQTATKGAKLILLRERFERLNSAFDESRITLVIVPDGAHREPPAAVAGAPSQPEPSLQGDINGDAARIGRTLHDAQQLSCVSVREPSLPLGLLRCAGAIIGFVTGGPAGAAVGSMLAMMAGEIIAERSILIWLKLRSIALWRAERRP